MREMLAVTHPGLLDALLPPLTDIAAERLRGELRADRQRNTERQRDRGLAERKAASSAALLGDRRPGRAVAGGRGMTQAGRQRVARSRRSVDLPPHPGRPAPGSDRPSYLPAFLPPMLDLLDEVRLRITFFVVGRRRRRAEPTGPSSRTVADAGARGRQPLVLARVLAAAVRPDELRGRRSAGPRRRSTRLPASGRSGSAGRGSVGRRTLLDVLAERGYRYDASTLPTYLGSAGAAVLPARLRG